MIRRWQDRQRAPLRQALNHPAASAWENLGLWLRPDQPYSEAARALAMRVGAAAGLAPGDSVLDIGPGHGEDQFQLWRNEFAIGDYYGWERASPAPPDRQWQHVVAVDSAYFVPGLWQRWQDLWPAIAHNGAITWSDLYLTRPVRSWRTQIRVHMTSTLASMPADHWCTLDNWLSRLSQLPASSVQHADLTDEVLGGFVRHMQWRRDSGQPPSGLRMAYGTAALLAPLLNAGVIGYGLFKVQRAATL